MVAKPPNPRLKPNMRRSHGGAMTQRAGGAMQVPVVKLKVNGEEVPYRCHEKNNKEKLLGKQ